MKTYLDLEFKINHFRDRLLDKMQKNHNEVMSVLNKRKIILKTLLEKIRNL